MKSKVFFLDCTLRDGGYYNSWDFSEELVQEYIDSVADIGVDVVELGFRSQKNNGFKGMFAFTPDVYLDALVIPDTLRIGVMVNASELLESSNVIACINSLFPRNSCDSCVSLVRIACHLHEVERIIPAILLLKDKGYQVGINLMQIAGQSKETITRLARLISTTPTDILYFADSLGSMRPDDVSNTIINIREGWTGALGIHTHDNMGMALQNTLRAIEDGVVWLDSTVAGMGRGPGNAKTEELAIEVAEIRSDDRSLVPIFRLVKDQFLHLKRSYGWGTNPFYYLAGKYGIHPTYIQEMLGDSRYDEADVLAVIDHLRGVGGKKFSASTLWAARSFYQGDVKGKWCPLPEFNNREVLILGAGSGVPDHKVALETFITNNHPIVIALNTQSDLPDELIDYRVACHPVRLMADAKKHASNLQPLIMPYSMLPEATRKAYNPKNIFDFGLGVSADYFRFDVSSCILPSPLVVAYALAIATSGSAKRILMAGFDGYGPDDQRSQEMQRILSLYEQTDGSKPIMAVTPTRYKIPQASIYLL